MNHIQLFAEELSGLIKPTRFNKNQNQKGLIKTTDRYSWCFFPFNCYELLQKECYLIILLLFIRTVKGDLTGLEAVLDSLVEQKM